ncbi:MAG TPA: glycosyltransferase [bacterium]|nr:glycosyltransferase [bacterium]
MINKINKTSNELSILYVITGLRLGGAEKLLLLTSKHLQATYSCRIKIVYFDPYAPMKKLFDDADITTVQMNRNLLTIPRLIKIILKEQFQVIHTHLIHADIFGRTAAILALPFHKHVIFTTVHDVHWFRWAKGVRFSVIRWIDLLQTIPSATHIIAISEAVKELLIHKQLFKPEKIEVLYNAIEISDVKGKKMTAGPSMRCLYLGRLVREKNIPCLLRAISRLRDISISLTIVGEGEEEARLRDLAEQLAISEKVNFVGATLEPEKYYQEHDIFILPSTYEGLGIVVLEAFRNRLPVIAANVHGISELLADNRGILFENDNAEELAECIRTLLDNPALRQEYGQRGYDYVKQHHDIREYVRLLNYFYSKALTANEQEAANTYH